MLDEPVSVDHDLGQLFINSPDDDIELLMAVMTERRIRHVPVVTDGVLAGIISIGDVVKSRIDELEKDRKELVEYINARGRTVARHRRAASTHDAMLLTWRRTSVRLRAP